MNEKRIKEIAEQANAWYPQGYPSAEGGDEAWKNLVIFEKEDLQKFAELIVKECVEKCKTDWYGDSLDDICKQMLAHFGVE